MVPVIIQCWTGLQVCFPVFQPSYTFFPRHELEWGGGWGRLCKVHLIGEIYVIFFSSTPPPPHPPMDWEPEGVLSMAASSLPCPAAVPQPVLHAVRTPFNHTLSKTSPSATAVPSSSQHSFFLPKPQLGVSQYLLVRFLRTWGWSHLADSPDSSGGHTYCSQRLPSTGISLIDRHAHHLCPSFHRYQSDWQTHSSPLSFLPQASVWLTDTLITFPSFHRHQSVIDRHTHHLFFLSVHTGLPKLCWTHLARQYPPPPPPPPLPCISYSCVTKHSVHRCISSPLEWPVWQEEREHGTSMERFLLNKPPCLQQTRNRANNHNKTLNNHVKACHLPGIPVQSVALLFTSSPLTVNQSILLNCDLILAIPLHHLLTSYNDIWSNSMKLKDSRLITEKHILKYNTNTTLEKTKLFT